MNIPFSLLLDIFIAVLLIVTIGYAFTLNKRLRLLRKDKEELQRLTLNFGDATARAEVGVVELSTSIDVLQERIKRAESLREDLVFLVERGNSTADKLEELVRASRDKVNVAHRQIANEQAVGSEDKTSSPRAEALLDETNSSSENVSASSSESITSDAEEELLKALRSAG